MFRKTVVAAAAFALALLAARADPVTGPSPQIAPVGRILRVGPGEALRLPSAAAAMARPGDTIRILPGRYADCSVWFASNLVIEGTGEVVIAGDICNYKALFVVVGNNVTVRGITFTGASNVVHNGAGIRAEGANLTVENSRFIDNEEGILAAANPASTLIVRASYFRGNGTCAAACAHGLYVGHIALLRVEHSEFIAQHVGHNIKSRAERTEILDNRIADGPDGTSSYLLDVPSGGALLVRGNRFEKGPHSQNREVAISIGAELSNFRNPDGPIEIDDNHFANDLDRPTAFVRNSTDLPAQLQGNKFTGIVTPLLGPGTVDGAVPGVR